MTCGFHAELAQVERDIDRIDQAYEIVRDWGYEDKFLTLTRAHLGDKWWTLLAVLAYRARQETEHVPATEPNRADDSGLAGRGASGTGADGGSHRDHGVLGSGAMDATAKVDAFIVWSDSIGGVGAPLARIRRKLGHSDERIAEGLP